MPSFDNPFSTDRAEQLGDKLFEFFAYHKSFEGILKHKSLILQGGRGSGKTMFYLYHTYDNKKKESLSQEKPFIEFIQNEKLIGIHFRADSNFVPAFQHKGISEEEWIQLFSHYLNLNLTKRLVEVIIDINASLPEKDFKNKLAFRISDESEILLGWDTPLEDFNTFIKLLKRRELELMSYINNPNDFDRPRLVLNGLLLNILAKDVLSQNLLLKKSIHVFIDEFENMLPYQQKIVNTLIKHPDPVIFDIGMRKEGLKTHQTLSDSEIISAPHDYNHFDLEELSDAEYEELILKICAIRLSKIKELHVKDKPELLDIKYYLGEYKLTTEVDDILTPSDIKNIQLKIKHKVGSSEDDLRTLHESNDPIILRLNLVLLDRGKKANHLAKELKLYNNKEKSKYTDWLHNNKMGLVFLLANEYKKDKVYAGFNTFKSVSSGITRYFIELCEFAFKNAYRNGFSFEAPRPLSNSEQTSAAYAVSKYKVNDIETFTPHSIRLKRFVMLLGNIYQALHHDKKISEPERNHFSTHYDKLTDEARSFINNSVLYSVLQRREQTKDKSNAIDSNNFEYHLNHIYTPYFQISARRIRSLSIKASDLEVLINGDTSNAYKMANTYVKEITKEDSNQLKMNI